MKRLLSLFLSLFMIFSLSTPAFAENNESLSTENDSTKIYISSYDCPPQYVTFATEKIGAFLNASEFSDYSPCYMGKPFTFANAGSNIYYFPVFYSRKIICILRVYSNEQGDIAGVLSKGFAENLNAVAKLTSITSPLHIYHNGSKIIFKSATTEATVFSYPENQANSDTICLSDTNLRTTVECSYENSSPISFSSESQRSTTSSRYLDIFESDGKPLETQGSDHWCSAYVASTILRYKGLSGIKAINVMRFFYGSSPSSSDALTMSQVNRYANAHSYITSLIDAPLSYVQLCAEINNNRPVFLCFARQSGNEYVYHAVALCGYNDTSAMMRIWNPWYDCYETIYSLYNYVPYDHQHITYVYDSTIYNWTYGGV